MKKLASETIITVTADTDYIYIATAAGLTRRFLLSNFIQLDAGDSFSVKSKKLVDLADGVNDQDAATIKQVLAGYYNFWYGIEVLKGQTSSVVTQIGDATMIAQQPVHAATYPAVVNEAGTIIEYLDKQNITLQTGGQPSTIDGSIGDVVRVFPDFYFQFEDAGDRYRIKISPYNIPGFTKVDEFMVGLFMADIDAVTGKLHSRSGVTPTTIKTRAQFRAAAVLKGLGWCQADLEVRNWLYWLWVIESGNLNSQAIIGDGATNANGTDWNNYNSYNPIWDNGEGNATEIITGEIPVNVPNFVGGVDPLVTNIAVLWQMRDIFGHLWEFCDGLNNHNASATGSRFWQCKNPANFADDTETNYELIGSAPEADGYISKFIPGSIMPIKDMPAGASSQHCGDYYYSYFDNDPNVGWRVLRVSGCADSSSACGLVFANCYGGSGYADTGLGSRLCFKSKYA